MKVEKTLKTIIDSQNQYYPNIYQVNTKSKNPVSSVITFEPKTLLVELCQYEPQEKYVKTFQVKNLEKGINLLLRAEKDFKKFDKRLSYPTLRTMEETYKNYFTEESEKSIVLE